MQRNPYQINMNDDDDDDDDVCDDGNDPNNFNIDDGIVVPHHRNDSDVSNNDDGDDDEDTDDDGNDSDTAVGGDMYEEYDDADTTTGLSIGTSVMSPVTFMTCSTTARTLAERKAKHDEIVLKYGKDGPSIPTSVQILDKKEVRRKNRSLM